MNVLLLYLFQSLPLEAPQKKFDEWNAWISRFIWNNRRPGVQFKTLQLKKREGRKGCTMPTGLLLCGTVETLGVLVRPKLCLEITQIIIPIQSIIGNKSQAEGYYNSLNPWTAFTLRLWFKVLKKSHVTNTLGSLSRWHTIQNLNLLDWTEALNNGLGEVSHPFVPSSQTVHFKVMI